MDREVYVKWLCVLPTIAILLGLGIFPLLFSFGLSFTSWEMARQRSIAEFIGLANFRELLYDRRLMRTILNTFLIVGSAITLEYIIGLLVATILCSNVRGRKFFRVSVMIPMMLTPVGIGYIWRMLFNESLGPINHLIRLLGLKGIPWASHPVWAVVSIIIIDVWQWTPFVILVLMAAMQSLSVEVYEAASVDGATPWQVFRFLTLPLVTPATVSVIILRWLEGFKMFDTIYITTFGGPGLATETASMYVYQTGLRSFRMGYASALTYALMIIVSISSMLFMRNFRALAE